MPVTAAAIPTRNLRCLFNIAVGHASYDKEEYRHSDGAQQGQGVQIPLSPEPLQSCCGGYSQQDKGHSGGHHGGKAVHQGAPGSVKSLFAVRDVLCCGNGGGKAFGQLLPHELIQAAPQQVGQVHQGGGLGHGLAGFPFAHRLTGDPHGFGQGFLGVPCLPAKLGQIFGKTIHFRDLLFCSHFAAAKGA